jgi:hypothetical protein
VTQTASKTKTFIQIGKNVGLKANIMALPEIGVIFPDPFELTGNYNGNAIKKIKAGLRAIRNQVEWRTTNKETPVSPYRSRVILMAEDSGFYFWDKNIMGELEFCDLDENIKKLVMVEGGFPGVETSPVLKNCGGVREFFKRIEAIAERRAVDSLIVQVSHIAAVSLDNPTKIFHIEERRYGRFRVTPCVNEGDVGLDHYFQPDLPRTEKTEFELGKNYWAFHSVKAAAMLGIIEKLGLETENLGFTSRPNMSRQAAVLTRPKPATYTQPVT